MDEVVTLINRLSHEFNVVGLTIAEPLPRTAIKLKNMMQAINLFH